MNNKPCCEAFERMVKNNVIIDHGSEMGFYIRGEPDFVDDGDDRLDDMTEEYVISHCPFCGSKLGASNG